MSKYLPLTHSFVFLSCADPFHHETDGAGLEPVTSHLNSYEWFVDKYFIFLSKTIVNGRTGRDKEEIEMEKFLSFIAKMFDGLAGGGHFKLFSNLNI
jgi:hypothetical protein